MPRHFLHQNRPEKPKNIKRDPVASGERDASVNRAASHHYFLLEKYEAGMMLTGTEVKAIRAGRANLKDAYGLVKDGELWLLNATSALTSTATSSITRRCAPASCWCGARNWTSSPPK